VLFYPFPDPNEPIFYRKPRSFLGTIYYDRLPCKPFEVYGPVYELPCPLVPTGNLVPTSNPSMPPPSTSPVTQEPAGNPTGSPTGILFVPTITVVPTLSPTTSEPNMSLIVPMRAYIITTLRNVPDRDMMSYESEKYVEILTAFLKMHTVDTMVFEGIDVWHSQLTEVNSKEGNVIANSADNADAIKDMEDADESGGALSEEEQEDAAPSSQAALKKRSIWDRRLTMKRWIPQVTAMEVTLVLRIIANLPSNLLGSMASMAIQENEQELIHLLHQQQAFYTFFKLVDGVGSRVIDQVTPPPLMAEQEVVGEKVGVGVG